VAKGYRQTPNSLLLLTFSLSL